MESWENEDNYFNPLADQDSHDALQQSPVNTRKNPGKIQFIQSGIEEAVFKVPRGKQVIVLDFADERMPGGYFLENAWTQEEVRGSIDKNLFLFFFIKTFYFRLYFIILMVIVDY